MNNSARVTGFAGVKGDIAEGFFSVLTEKRLGRRRTSGGLSQIFVCGALSMNCRCPSLVVMKQLSAVCS